MEIDTLMISQDKARIFELVTGRDNLKTSEFSKAELNAIRNDFNLFAKYFFDITSMRGLVDELRIRLKEDTKNRKLRSTARATEISHTYLAAFRDGEAVCMEIMNKLANHYGVSYFMSNYDPATVGGLTWQVDTVN